MPLKAPELDTRTFENLVEEARLRIPRYVPEWTDYNESDPGMSLVQLFAWLTEMMLYQMNQVPERNYIKFLKLLNQELRPAQPAVAHLTFTARTDAAEQLASVPARSQISAQSPDTGELLIFETETGLGLIRLPLTRVRVYDGATFQEGNQDPDTPFRPLGWMPQLGNALYLGFEQTEQPTVGRLFPQRMRFRVFLPTEAQKDLASTCTEVRQPPVAPVTLVWEYKRTDEAQHWRRLNLYKDESVAFTREGYIVVQGPAQIAATPEAGVEEPLFWLRCRLVERSYPSGREPVIDFIRPNTVEAVNLSTLHDELVGPSDGHPDQLFELQQTPVQPDSLKLWVEGKEEERQWERVPDFLCSGSEDRHFLLDATTGQIRFGDGSRGLIPEAGAEIVAREYRYGGGQAGNVGEGLIAVPLSDLPGVDTVTNERHAVGGRDEQDIEELKEQAPGVLRSRNRAVTVEDFKALAEQAGGVAKATAIPLMHPDHHGVIVPGAVTVVIVPDTKDKAPRPSPDQIREVCRYLEQFRLLTMEIFVKGPEYQAIRVEAHVEAQPYAAFDTVGRDVEKALNAYLDPLGRESDQSSMGEKAASRQGRRFGQDLHPTSLYDVILDVDGVAAVADLAIFVNGQPRNLTERVIVAADGLLYGTDHTIEVTPYRDL